MKSLSVASILFYCLFCFFVFYQKLHLKNFRGASQTFASVLVVSALAGSLAGVSYLVYYGWVVVWWAPIVIFTIGIASSMLGLLLERLISPATISLCGFIGWPVSAYFMFWHVPNLQ